MKDVTQSITNLDSLILSGCFNLTDEKLVNAFQTSLPCLLELNLSMCKKITDQSIFKICKSAQNLRHVDLAGCSCISNKCLEVIQHNLRSLKHLDLRSCRNVTDSGIAKLCGQIPSPAETDGYPSQQQTPVYDEDVGIPSLEFLGLQACEKLSDDALKYVSLGLRKLQCINLSFCPGFSELGLKYLSSMACSLKEINLRSCDNVCDTGLRYLSEGGVSLHVLDVSFCEKITDEGLGFLSQGQPQLQSLSLNNCRISDIGIMKSAQTLTELKVLNIGQCTRVTDKGINAIINNCPHLSSIDMYGCPSISSGVVDRLMSRNVVLSRDLWPETLSPNEDHPTQTLLTESGNHVSVSIVNNSSNITPSSSSSSTTMTTTTTNNNSLLSMSSFFNGMSQHNLEQFWIHHFNSTFGHHLLGSRV